MKIQIREQNRCFTIPLPNALALSPFIVKWALRRSGQVLSPDAADRLVRELRKLSRREEPWELVHVESADGEVISIAL